MSNGDGVCYTSHCVGLGSSSPGPSGGVAEAQVKGPTGVDGWDSLLPN